MIVFAIIAIVGLVFLGMAAMQPARWGKLYVASAILLCGMVWQHCSFIDEYLVACVLVGGLLLLSLHFANTAPLPEDRLGRIHKSLFYLFCFYFAAESVRGMLLTDFSKIRWVVYFLSLALGAWMISRKTFALPGGKQLLRPIVKASLAYFIAYLMVGFFAEPIFGMHWSFGQNIIWGGSSYAVYPACIAVPSCFMLAQDGNRKEQHLAWLTIFVVVIAAFYFDTRSCYFVLLACMMVIAIRFDIKKLLIMGIAFFSVLIFFTRVMWPDYQDFDAFWGTSILSSSNLLWNQDAQGLRPGDIGRFAHIHLAPQILGNNPEVLFIGTGYRASGWLIGPALADVFYSLGMASSAEASVNYESTVGITSIALETGIIGFSLLVANVVCTWLRVRRRSRGQTRLFLSVTLLTSLFWLLITNPTDMPLYFLLIMPHGIACRIAEGDHELSTT